MNIKERNSSFELVKILAIFCIVICHSIPTERIEYHFATSDTWLFLIILLRQMGSVGNAIFMVASTWFLVDSDNTSFKKVKNMIADNQLISLLFLSVMFFIYTISIKEVIKQVFPFLFATLWYITCYVVYYCLHGLVNRALQNIKINNFIPVVFVIFYLLFAFVLGGLYFTDLVGFIMIHVLTWYIKKILNSRIHKSRFGLGFIIFMIGLLGWIFGAVVFNYLGLRIDGIGDKLHYWNRFYNPFILLIAYGLIILSSSVKSHSVIINKISGLSLYIYIFTGNQLLRYYTDNYLYDYYSASFGNSMRLCFVFVLLYAIVKLLLGVFLSVIYKYTIRRIIKIIVDKECGFYKKVLFNR